MKFRIFYIIFIFCFLLKGNLLSEEADLSVMPVKALDEEWHANIHTEFVTGTDPEEYVLDDIKDSNIEWYGVFYDAKVFNGFGSVRGTADHTDKELGGMLPIQTKVIIIGQNAYTDDEGNSIPARYMATFDGSSNIFSTGFDIKKGKPIDKDGQVIEIPHSLIDTQEAQVYIFDPKKPLVIKAANSANKRVLSLDRTYKFKGKVQVYRVSDIEKEAKICEKKSIYCNRRNT